LKMDPNNDQLKKDRDSITRVQKNSMNDMMGLLQNPEIQKMMKENPQLLQSLLQNPNMFKDPSMMAQMMNMFGNKGASQGANPQAPPQSTPTPPPAQGSNPWNQEPQFKPEPAQPKAPEQKAPEPKPQPATVSPWETAKKQADTEYRKRNFQGAITHYNECIEINEKMLIPYNNKAACYIELKELDKAMEAVDKAIEVYKAAEYKDKNFEHYAKVLGRKGRIYFLKGEIETAIEIYKNSLMEDRSPAVEEHLREAKSALEKKEKLAYINPELSEKHREAGNDLFKKGDFGNAIKEYEEAKKRNPTDARVYNNIAICFVKIMKPNEAMKEVEKALEIDPKFIKAMLRKGMIHNLVKEHHKAMETFRKVLDLEPDNTEAKEGIKATEYKIAATMHEGNDEERTKRAMNDPEIVSIMQDPMVRIALEQMQSSPQSAMEMMQDRTLGPKIQKLIQAGIIKTK